MNVTGDNIVWTYNLTVPAGQTKELAYFTILANSTGQAINESNAIVGPNGFLDTAAIGLSSNDLAALANFQFNHAPSDITLSNTSVAENQPSGTAVGTFSTTDPDSGNTFTYSLVSGTGGTDNGSFTIAGNTLKTAAIFDYETKNSYSSHVRTTDQGGLWYEKVFTISVTDLPEAMTVQPSDLPATGTAYLTLKIGTDSKLHIYQTGTTTDIVPANVFADVTNVSITGRDNYDDILTVDFSGGNPIPPGGVSFDGGAGGGNSLILAGTSGGDSVTMTATQITLAGASVMSYSNVEFFGFDLGAGNSLLVDHATLDLNQDNAISAGTNVTIEGGILDLNGNTDTIGELTLISGSIINGTLYSSSYRIESGTITSTIAGPGALIKTTNEQADVSVVNASSTTVDGGQLTATSIVTGHISIGSGSKLIICSTNSGAGCQHGSGNNTRGKQGSSQQSKCRSRFTHPRFDGFSRDVACLNDRGACLTSSRRRHGNCLKPRTGLINQDYKWPG